MRRYETIYILRPTLGDDEITKIIDNTNAILSTDGGGIISIDKWGLRKLAYLIKKESNGYYVFCDYATDPANVTEMERKFRIDESIMKYMTLKTSDSIDSEGIEAARNEYEAAKVAAEEAEAEQEKEEQSSDTTETAESKKEEKTETAEKSGE